MTPEARVEIEELVKTAKELLDQASWLIIESMTEESDEHAPIYTAVDHAYNVVDKLLRALQTPGGF